MSPCGWVYAIHVALAHLYVVLTFPSPFGGVVVFLPFPDCVLDPNGFCRCDSRHPCSRK